MSKVIVHRHAARYLKRLPRPRRERIKDLLKKMETGLTDHPDVKPMFGEWAGYYRLRTGDLRIIFWFDEAGDIVYIDHIGPRGDVYK